MPCIWLLEKMNGKPEVDGTRKRSDSGEELPVVCFLFAASSLQQMGDSVHNSRKRRDLLPLFYIVFVPVLGIFLKKAAGWKVWMSVFLALIGLYFLCIKEGFSIGKGDIIDFCLCIGFCSTYSGD